mgnify:FL=1|tara:strand:+ start:155 stop:1267 length:1113 start_codon:yes stop_codon:yes gene_type:complete
MPGPFNTHNYITDQVVPCVGATFLITFLPLVIIQIVCTQLFELVAPNYPSFLKPIPALIGSSFVKVKEDSYMVLWVIWLAICLPLFLTFMSTFTLTWKVALFYNICRIGPMYTNFAHVYTLSHMEVHRQYQLFTTKNPFMKCVFNMWIGLFHGVVPGTFTHSHVNNHHKYDNDINDVYSTAGYRRDSVWSFCRYIVVWFAYATNFSTFYDMIKQGEYRKVFEVFLGSCYYVAFILLNMSLFGTKFALVTVVYPLIEGNILLALVNYTWHIFIEEGNDYVNSLTILNGENFIFSEEYHVVHHYAPGFHHSRYKSVFEKNIEKYDIVFQHTNLFELGITAILCNYKRLGTMVKDPPDDVEEILKKRLRATLW